MKTILALMVVVLLASCSGKKQEACKSERDGTEVYCVNHETLEYYSCKIRHQQVTRLHEAAECFIGCGDMWETLPADKKAAGGADSPADFATVEAWLEGKTPVLSTVDGEGAVQTCRRDRGDYSGAVDVCRKKYAAYEGVGLQCVSAAREDEEASCLTCSIRLGSIYEDCAMSCVADDAKLGSLVSFSVDVKSPAWAGLTALLEKKSESVKLNTAAGQVSCVHGNKDECMKKYGQHEGARVECTKRVNDRNETATCLIHAGNTCGACTINCTNTVSSEDTFMMNEASPDWDSLEKMLTRPEAVFEAYDPLGDLIECTKKQP